jgi:hypothetical protein
MQSVHIVRRRLEQYIRRVYLSQLLRGAFWALAAGLSYFLAVGLLEHLGWFSAEVRKGLFFSLLIVEGALAVAFVLVPLLQVFKVRRKLNETTAAQLLARQDAGLSDQLQTMLELIQHADSDLARAGLDQKARALQHQPIETFEQPQRSLKWASLLVVPLLGMVVLALTGQWDGVTGAAWRVARYNESFQKPLPYSLRLEDAVLDVETGQRASFAVVVEGSQWPEWVFLVMDDKEVALSSQQGPDRYQHEFPATAQPGEFYLKTADATWGPYQLTVRSKATLKQASIRVIPPQYTGVPAFELNALRAMEFPEGSVLQWRVAAGDADSVVLVTDRIRAPFESRESAFVLSTRIMTGGKGALVLANQSTLPVELPFSMAVVPDAPPVWGSCVLTGDSLFGYTVRGWASDDYGVSELGWVATGSGGDTLAQGSLFSGLAPSKGFEVVFSPEQLAAWKGKVLNLQFFVRDNDGLRGGKRVGSEVFVLRRLTDEERTEVSQQLAGSAGNRMEEMKAQGKDVHQSLDQLKREMLKGTESYQTEQRLKEVLAREEQLLRQMQQFSKEEALRKELSEEQPELREQAQDVEARLDETRREVEALLEEIKRLQEKEDMGLEDVQQLQQQQQRLNKQLERNEKLLKKLKAQRDFLLQAKAWEQLAEQQELVQQEGKQGEEGVKEQSKIQEQAEDLQSKQEEVSQGQMEEQEAQELAKEMKQMEESLNEASKSIQSGQQSKASSAQKQSAESMKKMAQMMQSAMAGQGNQQDKEDAETIRQLLKGLMYMSFEEEDLSQRARNTAQFDPEVEQLTIRQARMNEVSRMVNDTLAALAARNAKVGSYILEEGGKMRSYLESSGEALRERNLRSASSSQMFAMTHANNLALMLQESLEQMQQSMAQQMPGEQSCQKPGGGKEGLSDIIKQQKGLGEKMQQQQGGTQPGQTGYSAQQMAQILAEQEKLRESLQALKQSMGDRQAKEMLEEINALMEDQENDISMRRLDKVVMERQREIMTRLLESDQAIRQREQDPRRESKQMNLGMEDGIGMRPSDPTTGRDEELKVIPLRFSPHFQRVADQYAQP